MGERCAIRFVGNGDKNVSPWLYFHNGGLDFYAVSLAIEYVQGLPKADPTDGRRAGANHVVVGFVPKAEPDRIFDGADMGDGSGMDWGAWEVDIHTGVATAIGAGSRGVKRMEEPWAWDSEDQAPPSGRVSRLSQGHGVPPEPGHGSGAGARAAPGVLPRAPGKEAAADVGEKRRREDDCPRCRLWWTPHDRALDAFGVHAP